MARLSILLAFVFSSTVLTAPGCKGEVEVKNDPEVVKKLETCTQALADAKKLREDLEAQLAEAQLGGETVVHFEGDLPEGALLKVTGGPGPNGKANPGVASNAKDDELYRKFISSVRGSRGAIQQCYRRVLKNNTNLQARTVTVQVNVNYTSSGSVSGASSNPRISDAFNSCMGSVAKKWKLPGTGGTHSFQYKLTLTPES